MSDVTRRSLLQHTVAATACALLLLALGAGEAAAVDLQIMAEFRPSALDPTHNQFVNMTPQSGFCSQHATLCRPGDFTIDTGINVAQRRLFGGGEDPRERWYLAVDGNWRDVTVRNERSGHELNVRIRLFLIGMNWGLPNDGSGPGANGSATGGCRGRLGVGSGSFYRYAWEVPLGNAVCVRSPRAETDRIANYLNFSIGYHLETPNPLQAQDGLYSGGVSYTVGNGQQIDLGQGDYSDPELNLQLALNVMHDFQVRFPAETPRVQLAPDGGWSQWIDHGVVPARLWQELPFHLTTSMDFSMRLRCEHEVAGRCGIRNENSSEVVPVDVDVTLPGMSNVHDGRPAQHTALPPEGLPSPRFTPDGYLMGRRSTLRFTAGREAATEMLKQPGSRWAGDVTIVFDANP